MSDATDQLETDWDGFMESLLKKYPPLTKGSVMRELERQVKEEPDPNYRNNDHDR